MDFLKKLGSFFSSTQFNTALVAVVALLAPNYTDVISAGAGDAIATVSLVYNAISAYVARTKASVSAVSTPPETKAE